MSANSIRDTFFEECEELLEALDEGLTNISEGQHDSDTVNAVFRAVHSIKGGAGAFALDDLVEFAHKFETVFDEIRSDRLEFDDVLVALLFRAGDHLTDLVEAARTEDTTDETVRNEILAGLIKYIPSEEDEAAEMEEIDFQPTGLDFSLDLPGAEPEAQKFMISFKPKRTLYEHGHEPLYLLRSLAELGEVKTKLNTDSLPLFETFDPEESYLSWESELTTDRDESEIQAVFEFVDGLCDLSISATENAEIEEDGDAPEANDLAGDVELPETTGQESTKEVITEAEPEPTVEQAKPQSKEAAAPAKAKKTEKSSGPSPTLRVDLDRVDRLINAVGELIINQAMLAQRISEVDALDIREVESELEDYKILARDIQEGVMAIRAQPVKPLFQRMARIVREAATATQKKVKLETVGESTEVDKTVIERLADPLTHMIRNAVDHGIETPETRSENSKDETGVITLTAAHRSGNVNIEIRDDGAGLNRKKIYEIAQSKGLIPEDIELSDAEIDNLLFLPGFSTASEVSNLSGRGVGMDVVKNAVTALGGRVSITSVPGEGTTFLIVLPLTLAVMDGMVISVAGQTMVAPISSIVESIRPEKGAIEDIGTSDRLLSIRGNYVPIIEVAEHLGLSKQHTTGKGEVLLLVETEQSGQCALAVDAIFDQRQVVVKSLSSACGVVPGVSAATILGDGKIAMIIDTESITQSLSNVKSASPRLTNMKEAQYAN